MKITPLMTDGSTILELGSRLANARLEKNLTQAALADLASVSKRTVERLEAGSEVTQLAYFIRVCRALGFLERLDSLFPEATPGPMTLLKMHGRERRRASAEKPEDTSDNKWSWGDGK